MQPIIIDHFSRRKEFIQMLAYRGAKIGAEIGTDHGKYAQQLCEGIPDLKLICVDPWVAYTEGEEVHSQEEMDNILKEARERLAPYNCTLIEETSMKAVEYVPDNSLDFVFIDANHSYAYVLEDVTQWSKKVKPGGIIAGHDYKEDTVNDYGVIQALHEYTENNHIAPWFILHAGGRLVDCWLFFKQP